MRRLLALPLLLIGVAEPAAGQDRPFDDFPATTAVPFVSQGPADRLLCGGAVGAMVLRAHGLRGVYADDFAPLVRPAEGGITTSDLARAIEARGMRIAAGPASPDATPDVLLRRGPYVVLLEDGTDRYHYVVVVGAGPDHVRVHDPASGPDRVMDRADFLARWAAAGRWHLQPRGFRDGDEGHGGMAGPDAGPEAVSADTSPVMVRASAAFREGDHAGAARILEAAPSLGARGHRLLAASLFLSGEDARALDAWDAAGGLTLDLVRVQGARRTRVPVLHRLLALPEGGALRRHDLERARRRLELAPSVAAGQVSYQPVDATTAEVEVAVVERPRFPSPTALAAASGAALLTRSATLRASLTGAGESTTIQGRWTDAHRSGSLALAAPGFAGVAGLPGVITVEVGARTERHPDAESGGRWGRVQVEDWATGGLRWWAGVGGERWEDAGPAGAVSGGLELRPPRDTGDRGDRRFAGLEASLGGIGDAGYWTLRAGAGASLSDTGSRELRGRVWLDAVGDGAPLALLPGAGTGGARDRLLRAHPLETGGILGGPARGRTLVGGTLEALRWWDVGPRAPGLRLGLAAFVDGARPFRAPGPDPTDELMVDGGLGLRVAHPLLPGELRVDAATGLLGDGTALSAGWSIPLRH